MIRKSIHSISEIKNILKEIVLNNLEKNKKSIEGKSLKTIINEEEIYALSDRYKNFFINGYKCIECGIEGQFWALERFEKENRYHLNLYAIDENGKEVLMTKDHIVPKSLGGKDELENYQPMCCTCNEKKGNSYGQSLNPNFTIKQKFVLKNTKTNLYLVVPRKKELKIQWNSNINSSSNFISDEDFLNRLKGRVTEKTYINYEKKYI
jgi:5-methylcytosine-specific restriction endonuclease McrA